MRDVTFDEQYRPQFHYTVPRGWINDPIGLVHYAGEFHLFNDHNPFSCGFPGGTTEGEQSHWSHAVSTDLLHWEHLPIAVYPDHLGACWSGSGVVDWNNTSGFQTGDEPPIVLIYTSAGSTFGQSLTYSNDRGRTWTKYEGNPVIEEIVNANRDPKVFWHEPTGKWVMVLYVVQGLAHFFTSDDLKSWTQTATPELEDFFECPDLFEFPVDGDASNTKWVLHDARLHYWIGEFDGRTFHPETELIRGDFGSNFHAAQSWNDAPRRVQVGWMANGEYPDMPFSQQMSFPCELTLETIDGEVRLHRRPIAEIADLYTERIERTDALATPHEPVRIDAPGELLDVEATIVPSDGDVSLRIGDIVMTYADGVLECLERDASVPLIEGTLKLRVLVDRMSVEVFAADGAVVMSSCLSPGMRTGAIFISTDQGAACVESLRVSALRSIWKGR